VVKSHGGADALGFASAVDMAVDMARAEVIPKIIADHAVVAPLFRAANNSGAAAS
jgi:glycerol-3-phosphate acyltransferase PlsX